MSETMIAFSSQMVAIVSDLTSDIASIVRKLVCTMVANERRLTNQRFCLLRLPFILIHSVMTVAKAHIQVTALASKVTSHESISAICILYK